MTQVRNRCRFFFATACIGSVFLCVAATGFCPNVQKFVALALGLNLTVGLALTYDRQEWPHRVHEIIPYVVFLCECTDIAKRNEGTTCNIAAGRRARVV